MIAILPQKPPRFYRGSDYSTPCNLEAEESIIGGILIDPNAMERVLGILEPDYFLIPAHQIIYEAALELHAQDKEIDLMSMTFWLADNNQLEDVGGQAKIAMLAARTVSAVNIDQYAYLVRDKFVYRAAIEGANRVLASAQQNQPLDDFLGQFKSEIEALESLLVKQDGAVKNESEIRFNAICKELDKIEAMENTAYQDWEIRRLAKEWGFKSTKELLDFHAKFLDSRHRKGEKITYGLTEYFDKFANSSADWLIRGWIPNKVVTVLHAAGGVGKTRLVSSICRSLIAGKSWSGYDVDEPCCVLFIETDQGVVVNIKMIDEQGYLDESEEVRARFRINDNWNINQYGKLKAMLNEFRELHPYSKILVVVDSLTTVSTKATFSENDQEFARPLVRFRAIAEEFNCSFLVLHHSNRAGECRGSTAIFNAADQVWKLERVNKNAPAGPLFLDIQKTRVRAPGRYVLEYSDQTWTWTIAGRVAADDSIESGFTPTQQAILRHLSKYSGIGFEAEDLAEACNIGLSTCRKELGILGNEALISSVKQGRPRKVYFIGTLTSKPKPPSAAGLTPLGKWVDSVDPVDPIDPVDPFDPLIREKNNGLEKNEKNADQRINSLIIGVKPSPSEDSILIQAPDQNGSNGSKVTELNNLDQEESLESSPVKDFNPNKGLDKDENTVTELNSKPQNSHNTPTNVTVNVPEAIADTKLLSIGDKIVSATGTEIAEILAVNSQRIYFKPLKDCGQMVEKGFAKAKWSNDQIVSNHKEFKSWVDVMQLRVKPAPVESVDEPNWQAGQKLKLSVQGQMQRDVVEFIGYHFTLEGVALAIVKWMGKQHFVSFDRLSEAR